MNDSENYLALVSMGKMTYETLNRIQDAQAETYEKLIDSTLRISIRFTERGLSKSINQAQFIALEIARIENELKQHEDIYYKILKPHLHRGIKYGAKFITAKQYQERDEESDLMTNFYHEEPYTVFDGNPLVSQMKFAKTEVLEKYLQWLKTKAVNSNTIPLGIQRRSKGLKSFQWQVSETTLEHLFKALIDTYKVDGKPLIFIASDTRYETFKAVFNGAENPDLPKIRWMTLSRNKSTSKLPLIHLIKELADYTNRRREPQLIKWTNDWQKILLKHFSDADGKPFKEIKNSNQGYDNAPLSKPPYSIITQIVNDLGMSK